MTGEIEPGPQSVAEELQQRLSRTRAAIGHLAQAHAELLEAGQHERAQEVLDQIITTLGDTDLGRPGNPPDSSA